MKSLMIRLNVDYAAVGLEKQDDSEAFLNAYIIDDPANSYPRKAVIVCPGGGYTNLSPREGEPVAIQFSGAGMQTFVLNYSVAPATFPMALMELATAVATVRDHAKEWNIDPNGIFILGFSAGGHLCAELSTQWHRDFLCDALHINAESIRPNGCILCYPRINYDSFLKTGRKIWLINGYPEENQAEFLKMLNVDGLVDAYTPPTFVWSTWDDNAVDISDSLRYIHALRENGVNTEIHLFRKGPHGMSLATEETAYLEEDGKHSSVNEDVAVWKDLCISWINDLKGGEGK